MTGLIAAEVGYEFVGDPGEPSTGKRRLSISDREAEILSGFARDRAVLELGTGLGVSTRALAQHARSVITVDIDAWVAAAIWPTLADLPNVSKVDHRGQLMESFVFDLAFIDADHSTAAVREDIGFCRLHMSPGGKIVLHDARYPSVIRGLSGEKHEYIETEHGLAVISC